MAEYECPECDYKGTKRERCPECIAEHPEFAVEIQPMLRCTTCHDEWYGNYCAHPDANKCCVMCECPGYNEENPDKECSDCSHWKKCDCEPLEGW